MNMDGTQFKVGDKVSAAMHPNQRRPLIVVRVKASGKVVVRGRNNRLMTLQRHQVRLY